MASIDSLARAIGAALERIQAVSTGIAHSNRIAGELRQDLASLGSNDKVVQLKAVETSLENHRVLIAAAATRVEDALARTEALRDSGVSRGGGSTGVASSPPPSNAARPDFARVEFDQRKLTSYALDPAHPVGRHKAGVIRSRTGLGRDDAPEVRRQILDKAPQGEAIPGKVDGYGSRWNVDVELVGPKGSMMVRTGWITDRAGATRLATVSFPPKGER